MTTAPRRRAVIVSGARTPFVRAFGDFVELDSIALADQAVRGLLDRVPTAEKLIDAIVWGGVILPAGAPNIAREIALDLGLGHHVEGHTVTRACTSGLQAITTAAAAIERGEYDVMIAGGSDSVSNASINLPQKLVQAAAPIALGKSSPRAYLDAALGLAPFTGLLPTRPKIAERTTGEVMGESADKMAAIHSITREAQDEFAARSHARAAAAIASGRFDREVVPVTTPDGTTVTRDGLVRDNTDVAKLAALRPVFNADGTVTAGNASPLTDGAAAVLLMSEDKARELGLQPLAAIRSWSYVSVDPADEVLIGPAISMPRALDKAGLLQARGRGLRGHPRGLRGPDPVGPRGAGQRRLGRRAARPRHRGRRGRNRPPQRARRVRLDRAPVRRHRRPHGLDDGQRARSHGQGHRTAGHLRRRRPRRQRGARARGVTPLLS